VLTCSYDKVFNRVSALASNRIGMVSPTARIDSIYFHGLEALPLTAASGASAVVGLRGAQVLSWITVDGTARLAVKRSACGNSSKIRRYHPVFNVLWGNPT